MTGNIEAARRHVTRDVRTLFEAEIANERQGGISPATLSSAIDSVSQWPTDLLRHDVCGGDDPATLLTALLNIRDLLPGDTEVRDLL